MHPSEIRRRAVSLYESGLSVRVVAKRLEVEFQKSIAPQTVARWMRLAGISRLPGAPRIVSLPSENAMLYRKGVTSSQLSVRYAVSPNTVLKRLREAGVRVRPTNSVFAHILTKGRLRTMYLEKRESVKRIANRYGCSIATVYRLLTVHGLRRAK